MDEAINLFEIENPRFCRQNGGFDGSCAFWYESYGIAVERRAIYLHSSALPHLMI